MHAVHKQRIRHLASRRVAYVTVFLSIGVLGSVFLVGTRALTPTKSAEVEQGKIAGCATAMNLGSSSNGAAVKFGTSVSGSSCTAAGFKHPGVFLNKTQLDYVKSQINFTQVATGATSTSYNQWTNAYIKATKRTTNAASGLPGDQSRLDFTPQSVPANLDCSVNKPVCTAMWAEDSAAAYSQALLYYYAPSSYTNKRTYGQNAVKILNAWANLKSVSTANGGVLDSAWAAENFTKAAEIMRYNYTPSQSGDLTLNTAGLETMFNMMAATLFDEANATDMPFLYSSNGNWDLSAIDALYGIAVFNDDEALYTKATNRLKARIPAYYYLTSDNGGNGTPLTPPGPYYNTANKVKCYWYAGGTGGTETCGFPAGFVSQNGLTQETCRDRSHAGMGMISTLMALQTAYIQGDDLYKTYKTRLLTAFDAQAKYNEYVTVNGSFIQSYCLGNPMNDSPTGAVGLGMMGWEIFYNHYVKEDTSYGLTASSPEMANVLKMIQRYQPTPVLQQGVLDTLTSSAYDKNRP